MYSLQRLDKACLLRLLTLIIGRLGTKTSSALRQNLLMWVRNEGYEKDEAKVLLVWLVPDDSVVVPRLGGVFSTEENRLIANKTFMILYHSQVATK